MNAIYKYACLRCNRSFYNKQDFVDHVWRKHGHRVGDLNKSIQRDNATRTDSFGGADGCDLTPQERKLR